MERARLLPNRPHSIKLGVSLSPRSRCRCCSPPPNSENSSYLVGNPQWTLRGVPGAAISGSAAIRATKPALQDEGDPQGHKIWNAVADAVDLPPAWPQPLLLATRSAP